MGRMVFLYLIAPKAFERMVYMRKIYKIVNIVLIFMFIGVLMHHNVAFCASEKTSTLRSPLYFGDSSDSNKETLLNSKGESFDDIWKQLKNTEGFERIFDPRTPLIEHEEKEIAEQYAKMSLKELESVLKDLTDREIITGYLKCSLSKSTEFPLITAFIDHLSSLFSNMEHYCGDPVWRISSHKRALSELKLSTDEKTKHEKWLIESFINKVFMYEIVRRWRKPRVSDNSRYPCLLFASKIADSIKNDSSVSNIPKPSNVESDTDKNGNTWVFQRDEGIYLEIDTEGVVREKNKHDLAKAMYEVVEVHRNDKALIEKVLEMDSINRPNTKYFENHVNKIYDGSQGLIVVINPKNSEIVGYREYVPLKNPNEICLGRIFIKPDYRKKEIYFMLAEYCTRQFNYLELAIALDGPDNHERDLAIYKMYEDLGFRLEGDSPILIWERLEPAEEWWFKEEPRSNIIRKLFKPLQENI